MHPLSWRSRGSAALLAITALAGLACPRGAQARPQPDGDALAAAAGAIDAGGVREKIAFLADDAREGREAGTAGNRAAARYIAEHFERLGLEPLGGADTAALGPDRFLRGFEWRGRACHNVVGLFRGTGDPARDGHVVIGAHYDHLGQGSEGSLDLFGGGPAIHNGADDNASGTAAVLEIAEALAALPARPRGAVVLVLFDAEEKGLVGAHAYCADPPLALERCRAMVNLDMVGRGGGGRPVLLVGATSGEALAERLDLLAGEVDLALEVRPYMMPNSDHFAYYAKRVPVAFLTTGLHADYHRPSDDADKIDADRVVRIADLAFRGAVALAAEDEPIAFRSVRDIPAGSMAFEMLEGVTGVSAFGRAEGFLYGGLEGAAVRTGERGLEVEYVSPRSAMAAAGLRTGDRIVEADGRGARGRLGRGSLRLALADGRARLAVERGADRLALEVERGARAEPAPRPGAPEAPRRRAELF